MRPSYNGIEPIYRVRRPRNVIQMHELGIVQNNETWITYATPFIGGAFWIGSTKSIFGCCTKMCHRVN